MSKLTIFRERAGLTGPELARLVGAGAPEIWRLERWPHKGGRKMTLQWAERLAPALKISPQELLFGDAAPSGSEPPGAQDQAIAQRAKLLHAPIRGSVGANKWFLQEEFIDEDMPPIPFIPSAQFGGLEQFAFKVYGPCMELKRIFNGDYVICVHYFEARQRLTDGDLVIVERRRGHMIERTCKELKIVKGGYELWPRSPHPRFQEPIRVKDNRDVSEEDGFAIEVIALVIGRYAPI